MGQQYDLLDLEDNSDSDGSGAEPDSGLPSSSKAPGDLSALAVAAAKLQAADPQLQAGPAPTQCQKRVLDGEKTATGAFRALAALPHDLNFIVPLNCRPGQPVLLQGPHGPLPMPLPQGYQAGERCTVRFGPTGQVQQVTVPDNAKVGDLIKFEGATGEQLEARVPPGLKPGDTFEASPPVVMVQVPKGAQTGDEVIFAAPDGSERSTKIPRGVQAGQYFPALV